MAARRSTALPTASFPSRWISLVAGTCHKNHSRTKIPLYGRCSGFGVDKHVIVVGLDAENCTLVMQRRAERNCALLHCRDRTFGVQRSGIMLEQSITVEGNPGKATLYFANDARSLAPLHRAQRPGVPSASDDWCRYAQTGDRPNTDLAIVEAAPT